MSLKRILNDLVEPWVQYGLSIMRVPKRRLQRLLELQRLYGLTGLLVGACGSSSVWLAEAKVISEMDDNQAIEFRKSVQDECTMIAIAAALVAQLSLTALSLVNLSQTHWVARGSFALSLVSALFAVAYAATQHIIMSHLLSAKQVRHWIRGGNTSIYIDPLTGIRVILTLIIPLIGPGIRPIWLTQIKMFHPQEPTEPLERRYIAFSTERSRTYTIMRQCFTPGVTSVITMSAPIILLATSIVSAVIGFGIYFGFTWTRNLDKDAGLHDSRNVFIVYIVGLGFSVLVYAVSQNIQDDVSEFEYEIIEAGFNEYEKNNPNTTETWRDNDNTGRRTHAHV